MTIEIDSETAEVAELFRLAGTRPEDAVMEQARDFLAEGVHTPDGKSDKEDGKR